MILENLRLLARASVPGAKLDVITAPVLDLILNNAVVNISAHAVCLKGNTKFSAVADQAEYTLSSLVTNYLTPDKPGLYWNAGTALVPSWKKLNPRTLAWLDENRPNWRDLESGTPQDYSIDGDIVTIVPAPVSSLTNGLWFYHGKKPIVMTAAGHYPFSGSATEIPHLSIFDDAILLYAKWKINPILNKDAQGGMVDITEATYKRELEEKTAQFKRRLDISNKSKFGGDIIR